MSIGPHPGQTYKLECVAIGDTGVSFVGDGVSMVLNGPRLNASYYEVGKSYIWHVRPVDGYKPDDRASQAPPK